MTTSNIVDIALNRYTTKHYNKDKQISDETLSQLLDVLKYSPSSVNSQPWHFLVIDNQSSQQESLITALPDFNHSRVKDSSYTIAFCVKTSLDESFLQRLLDKEDEDGRYPNENLKQQQDQGRKFFIGLHQGSQEDLINWEAKQAYIALGQLLFAASTIGVDSTAIEGFDAKKFDEIYNLKEKGLTSLVLATIGYRSSEDGNANRPKSRLTNEELFTFYS